MPGRTGTCKDLVPEQQGRERLEKEASPLGNQRQHTEEEKEGPPARKQWRVGLSLCLTQALRVRHRFSKAICL